jgi:hypothetical protein
MKKSLHLFVAVMAVLVLVITACAPATEAPTEVMTEAPTEVMTEAPTEVMTEAPTEAPAAELGSPERPIKVLFVPSVDVDFMIESGDLIANALNEATVSPTK